MQDKRVEGPDFKVGGRNCKTPEKKEGGCKKAGGRNRKRQGETLGFGG